jgi:hypothetical protein
VVGRAIVGTCLFISQELEIVRHSQFVNVGPIEQVQVQTFLRKCVRVAPPFAWLSFGVASVQADVQRREPLLTV